MSDKKQLESIQTSVMKFQGLFEEDQFKNTPEQLKLVSIAEMLNNLKDSDGQFPILINGRVSKDSERGDDSYWDKSILETVSEKTGHAESEFMYVDGDQGRWPTERAENGAKQGGKDASKIYAKLKESVENGIITESLQVVSHSRGGAFAQGYMEAVAAEVTKLAKKDGIGLGQCLVEYSVNLAPHQSNWIDYEDSCTKNVNISHRGDILSGDDATGNVINVHTLAENAMGIGDQHRNANHNTELGNVLDVLESNENKDDLYGEVKQSFKDYDNSDKKKTYPNSVVKEGRK